MRRQQCRTSSLFFPHTPESVNGENTVESVTVRDVKTGKTKDLPVAGVFIAVGQTPKTDLVKDQVETDEAELHQGG